MVYMRSVFDCIVLITALPMKLTIEIGALVDEFMKIRRISRENCWIWPTQVYEAYGGGRDVRY